MLVGAKCLANYSLGNQVASAGPGLLWRIYSGRNKKEGKLCLKLARPCMARPTATASCPPFMHSQQLSASIP